MPDHFLCTSESCIITGKICVILSGYNLCEDTFNKLIEAGVTNIFISLNGSTEEINAFTRDGYLLAIEALAFLQNKGFKNTIINWVMHRSNADDFENMLQIAEKYEVSRVVFRLC